MSHELSYTFTTKEWEAFEAAHKQTGYAVVADFTGLCCYIFHEPLIALNYVIGRDLITAVTKGYRPAVNAKGNRYAEQVWVVELIFGDAQKCLLFDATINGVSEVSL